MQRKKLAIITPTTTSRGGAERAFEGLAAAFLGQNVDCELVQIPDPATDRASLRASIVSVAAMDLSAYDAIVSTKFPAYHCRHPNHVVYMMHPARSLYDMFELENPDPSPDMLDFQKSIVDADSRALRSARHLFAVGHEAASRLMTFNKLHATVIHHPSTLDPLPAASRVENFLFLPGRLHGWKRVDLAIDAMRYVKGGFHLLIAGSGPDEQRLRRKAAGSSAISFLGEVSDGELASLYARCLATVYVPHREDFGLVTIESFDAATPVITTYDSGEPSFFVIDGVTGLVAQPHPIALASAFDYAFSNPQRMREFGRSGQLVAQKLRWENVATALLASMRLLPVTDRQQA